MVLSKHINSLELESTILKNLPKARLDNLEYIDQYDSQRLIPRFEIPFKSSDGSLIHKYLNQELTLDGNPTLNLASFVNTWVDPTQIEIAVENLTKNLADNDEYPSLIDIQARCITMLSNLWHAPSRKDEAGNKIVDSIGTATTGSSEAIMLAGLALKKRWQEKRLAEGKDISKPNILMATCAQVALEKFAVYFDVENRLIPISPESGHVIDTSKIRENIDENTIGIFVILGSTFTGAFEPVEEIAQLLDEHEKETGLNIRIHVDGASGGFVAPFAFPNLKWDFSIDRVDSINTSGHKFGMTSVGLGWVIWKHADLLPKQLKFNLDYLGGVEETFGLNFSRPGFPVIMQYYNFLTLGKEGYAAVFDGCMSNARLLSDYLSESKYFEVVSNIHKRLDEAGQKKAYTKESHHQLSDIWTINQQFEPGLPVVAFRFSKEFRDKYPEVPQELFSTLLRKHGYIVPNYHLPPTENDVEILRVVVRNSMSLSLMSKLVSDCTKSAELLVKAAEFVRNYDHTKADKTSEQRTESIHELLLTIASGGTAQVKKEQHEKTGHESGKHKTSYRGTC